MDFSQVLTRRQSCRSYDPRREVSKEDVLACIEAAGLAPSACNSQPYYFTVCTGEFGRAVAKACTGMGMNKFALDAPCLIVVREAPYNKTAAVGSKFKNQDYRSIDIGLAVSQLVLEAQNRGLATCILGWFDEKKLKDLLDTDAHIRLVITLGYAKEGDPLRKKSRKEIEKIVEFKE
ncbi:MAG: nitroreductase family protein [Oscillospiraceae bacterium]|nr:nitroreductase family protein [Oscillospiraceae bacterium]